MQSSSPCSCARSLTPKAARSATVRDQPLLGGRRPCTLPCAMPTNPCRLCKGAWQVHTCDADSVGGDILNTSPASASCYYDQEVDNFNVWILLGLVLARRCPCSWRGRSSTAYRWHISYFPFPFCRCVFRRPDTSFLSAARRSCGVVKTFIASQQGFLLASCSLAGAVLLLLQPQFHSLLLISVFQSAFNFRLFCACALGHLFQR